MTDLDKLEELAKAALSFQPEPALSFQPEPPSDGWPGGEPETAPEWDATGGWLVDGGHAAFGRQHQYSVDQYSDDQGNDGAEVDAAYIKAVDPATVLALVAECRELRRLRGALEFLDVHARIDLVGQARHLPCAPQNVIALATELGWKEGT